MSSTTVNVNRSVDAADYIKQLDSYNKSNQNANSAGTNFQPLYILGLQDVMDITDSVVVPGNAENMTNTIDITDSMTKTNQGTGTFLIDTAKIGFGDIG